MSNADDFVIEKGVLTTYNGTGGAVTIPDGVTSIGDGAFEDCTSLTSIIIPNSVIRIGTGAFFSCSGLASISIPASVTTIGDGAFQFCVNLTGATIPVGITKIDDYTFAGCSNLANVTIPSSVTSIGFSAFSDCANLISVSIPSSVISIEGSAFCGCTNLTNISIPSGITRIENHTFADCSSLKNVTIPDSVASIGEYAFHGCTNLTNIVIPANATIGGEAFGKTPWQNRQEEFVIKNGVLLTYQGSSKEVVIPDGVSSIGSLAFSCRANLTSISIPSSVTKIGKSAFYGCTSLSNISIPSSVTSIEGDAFESCIGLTSISIPPYVTNIASCLFAGCSNLANVTIPSSVTSIGESAFANCTNLTSVNILDGVAHIRDYAFEGCISLTRMSIPSSITSIGFDAFCECVNLTDVYYSGSKTQWRKIDIDYDEYEDSDDEYPAGRSNNSLFNANIRYAEDISFSLPLTVSIEGTAYANRNERIEHVHVGDSLVLKVDWESQYYWPVAIEVFNAENETLGFLKSDWENNLLFMIANYINTLQARVVSVTPLSQRRKNAKYALLDVEISIKKVISSKDPEDGIRKLEKQSVAAKEKAETLDNARRRAKAISLEKIGTEKLIFPKAICVSPSSIRVSRIKELHIGDAVLLRASPEKKEKIRICTVSIKAVQ